MAGPDFSQYGVPAQPSGQDFASFGVPVSDQQRPPMRVPLFEGATPEEEERLRQEYEARQAQELRQRSERFAQRPFEPGFDSPLYSPVGNISRFGPQAYNLRDEMAGLNARIFNIGQPAGQRVDPSIVGEVTRERVEQMREEEPVSTFFREMVGGGILTAPIGGAAPQAVRAAAVARPGLAGLASGAAHGAVAGAGAAEGDLADRATGAGVGALIGAPLGAAGGRAGAMLPGRGRGQMPEIDDLRTASRAAYQAVDDLGARYTPQATDDMVSGITRAMHEMRISPERHPRAHSMLVELQERRGQNLSLSDIDVLRQVIRRDVANSTDRAESAFGARMISEIDDFISGATPQQMAAGDNRAAAQAIRTAREAHGRLRKSELLEDAVERAVNRAASTGTGGNLENAIRQNVRRMLDNPRTARTFTAGERRALQRFVRGDVTQNTLRLIGRLSPTSGALMAALGVGGTVAYSPLAALPLAGMAARAGSDAMQRQRLQQLRGLLRGTDDIEPGSLLAAGAGHVSGLGGGILGGHLEADRRRRMGLLE